MDARNGSVTPNSMTVLERGAGGSSTLVSSASRPPSGRRSRNKTPVQRSGSQLEVLPPSDEKSSNSSEDSGRVSLSAGSSSGRRSRQGQENAESLARAASLDSGMSPRDDPEGASRPGSAVHKQVDLTTVKRNYEMHGAPKNENYDFLPKDIIDFTPPLLNGQTHHAHSLNVSANCNSGSNHDSKGVLEQKQNGDGHHVMSEEERLNYLMTQLSTKNEEIRQHEDKRRWSSSSDQKGASSSKVDKKPAQPSPVTTDSYYVSTGSLPATQSEAAKVPPFLEDKNEGDEDDDDESSDDEEEQKAPIELMSEFLDAVMEEDYETADKLCKMILIYEPENPECLQFKPLIEEMLKREWHHQLWGSSSEGESEEDEEGEDDDEDDDDEEDDEDEGNDDSESSEDSDDDDDDDDNGNQDDGRRSKLAQLIIEAAQDGT